MDIKEFLNNELGKAAEELQSSKLEADKLSALQGMSNIITLLTQLEQLENIELNNMLATRQLIEMQDAKPAKKSSKKKK